MGGTEATLYSVVGTYRRVGVEPFVYLRDVFAHGPATPPEQAGSLLPRKPGGPASTRP